MPQHHSPCPPIDAADLRAALGPGLQFVGPSDLVLRSIARDRGRAR